MPKSIAQSRRDEKSNELKDLIEKKRVQKTNLLRNSKSATRAFILSLYLQKIPVFEAYSKFCGVLGDELMEYREFDLWYYQIGNGDADLDCEMSWDPESRGLSDMPLAIVHNILENIPPLERFVIRDVSSNLRSLFDYHYPVIKKVTMEVNDGEARLKLNNQESLQQKFRKSDEDEDSNSYLENAMDQLETITTNNKLEEFELRFGNDPDERNRWELNGKFRMMFLFLRVQLNSVRKFSIGMLKPHDAQWMFFRFKPRVLEEIEIRHLTVKDTEFDDDEVFEENMEIYKPLTELEHWQKAKKSQNRSG